MRNTNKFLKIIGIIISIFSFFFSKYDNTRLIIMLLGLFMVLFSGFQNKKEILKRIIDVVILFTIFFIVDTLLVYFDLRYPIFASKTVSSSKVVNYNNAIYTLYECDNNKTFDLFYRKSHVCKINDYKEKDINTLSSDIVNNFKKYKNKYFIIDGKISLKEGNNNLKMQSYTLSEEALNGNVVFNDNIIFNVELSDNLYSDNFKLYDNVEILGKIKSIKKDKDDIYTINVINSYIINNIDYSSFSINVVEDNKCQKDKTLYETVDDVKYYTSCLSTIYAVYDTSNVYELSYALKDKKVDSKGLISGYIDYEEKEIDEKTSYKLYKYENYNILKCDDQNIIIGNKKLDFDNNYCSVNDSDNNDL